MTHKGTPARARTRAREVEQRLDAAKVLAADPHAAERVVARVGDDDRLVALHEVGPHHLASEPVREHPRQRPQVRRGRTEFNTKCSYDAAQMMEYLVAHGKDPKPER